MLEPGRKLIAGRFRSFAVDYGTWIPEVAMPDCQNFLPQQQSPISIHVSTCRDLFHQEIQSNEIAPEVCSPVIFLKISRVFDVIMLFPWVFQMPACSCFLGVRTPKVTDLQKALAEQLSGDFLAGLFPHHWIRFWSIYFWKYCSWNWKGS